MREDGHAALRMEFDKFQRIKYTHEKLESTVQKIMKKKKIKDEMTINKPLIETPKLKYFRQGIR